MLRYPAWNWGNKFPIRTLLFSMQPPQSRLLLLLKSMDIFKCIDMTDSIYINVAYIWFKADSF